MDKKDRAILRLRCRTNAARTSTTRSHLRRLQQLERTNLPRRTRSHRQHHLQVPRRSSFTTIRTRGGQSSPTGAAIGIFPRRPDLATPVTRTTLSCTPPTLRSCCSCPPPQVATSS
uniref:(northern house mosquito) hypothetical protein n=1 Tax=Culex pipiens TaxID=7175 RepID=A0A8D8ING7_CULPI